MSKDIPAEALQFRARPRSEIRHMEELQDNDTARCFQGPSQKCWGVDLAALAPKSTTEAQQEAFDLSGQMNRVRTENKRDERKIKNCRSGQPPSKNERDVASEQATLVMP
jgi:hypothetical protein